MKLNIDAKNFTCIIDFIHLLLNSYSFSYFIVLYYCKSPTGGCQKPHGDYRQPGPWLYHVHAVWGGQWVDERICDRIEVNLAKSRAETIVRKATGYHLTNDHPKKHGRKILNQTYVAGR